MTQAFCSNNLYVLLDKVICNTEAVDDKNTQSKKLKLFTRNLIRKMKNLIDPKIYGLSGRTVIQKIKKNHLALVKDRKSRIIMKDGVKILEQAEKIWESNAEIKVSVLTSAPLCSKTIDFLNDKKIGILKLNSG